MQARCTAPCLPIHLALLPSAPFKRSFQALLWRLHGMQKRNRQKHDFHVQVGELASHMHSACEQQYLATMGLLLDMQQAVNPVARAFLR